MKIVIGKKKHYWKKGDLHTSQGVIKEEDILKNSFVKSHIGGSFLVIEASFEDIISKFKRGPAIMVLKDISYIIAKCGLGCSSKVVEAGSGCGVMTSYLGRICKVVSYENNLKHFRIASENIKNLGSIYPSVKKNVKLVEKDVSEISEKDLDMIFLDLNNPWENLDIYFSCLKKSGFLVCYLPNITQVKKVIDSVNEESNLKFYLDEVCEVNKRDWIVDSKRVRPENISLVHTGFLVFLRKI